ncbi:MAG: hypothetical protein ACKO1L_07965 [Brachymonas sp.]
MLTYLTQLYRRPLDSHDGIWRSALRKSQQQVLQDREVQLALAQWLKQLNCIEYVVLAEPFGLLALDLSGHAHWLQFEQFKDLVVAVDVAQAAGLPADDLRKIQQGLALSNAEWHQAMQRGDEPEVSPTRILGTGGHLVVAHFALTSLGKLGASHEEFLAKLPSREVDA